MHDTQLISDEIISVRNLYKTYGKTTALQGLTLSVRSGEIFALLGPNGSGKTTLVKILSTLTQPSSGIVTVAGFPLPDNAAQVRKLISLTGQEVAVDELLSARENLRTICRLRHLTQTETRHRTAELLTQFGLESAADRPVSTFSGGMRRRLDIAMALVRVPKILFLDEPTTGLDPQSRNQVWNTVKELSAQGTTILLTTQYLEEADQLADRIAIINRGQLITEGTANELKNRLGSSSLELRFPDGSLSRTAIDGTAQAVQHVLNQHHNLADLEIQIVSPSLDDVFLELTGNTAQPPNISTEHHVTDHSIS